MLGYDWRQPTPYSAKQRADFDIRWKVPLGIEVQERPLGDARSYGAVCFVAQLILHALGPRAVIQRSLQIRRQSEYLKGRRMPGSGPTPTTVWAEVPSRSPTGCWPYGIVPGWCRCRFLTSKSIWKSAPWGMQALRQGLDPATLAIRVRPGIGKGLPASRHPHRAASLTADSLLQPLCRPGVGAGLTSAPGSVPRGELPVPGYSGSGGVAGAGLSTAGHQLGIGIHHHGSLMSVEAFAAAFTAVDRISGSCTRPGDAVHGRKSSSKRFEGHKAAILLDIDSQLVTCSRQSCPSNCRRLHWSTLALVELSSRRTDPGPRRCQLQTTRSACGLLGMAGLQ